MQKYGGLFSVRLKTTDTNLVELFVNSLERFIIGVFWGGHESLVFPAITYSMERTREGLSNNSIRFYIGLNDADSLIKDLDQAFRRII